MSSSLRGGDRREADSRCRQLTRSMDRKGVPGSYLSLSPQVCRPVFRTGGVFWQTVPRTGALSVAVWAPAWQGRVQGRRAATAAGKGLRMKGPLDGGSDPFGPAGMATGSPFGATYSWQTILVPTAPCGNADFLNPFTGSSGHKPANHGAVQGLSDLSSPDTSSWRAVTSVSRQAASSWPAWVLASSSEARSRCT